MQFRIVGQHQHRAADGPSEYLCIRFSITTDAGTTNAWTVSKNGTVLKGDCRTLNEAKRTCREAAASVVVLPRAVPAATNQLLGALRRMPRE